MEQFPDLKTVDLRNNPIYCEEINAGVPLKVITDCKTSKPTTHHRITEKIIPSTRENSTVNLILKEEKKIDLISLQGLKITPRDGQK